MKTADQHTLRNKRLLQLNERERAYWQQRLAGLRETVGFTAYEAGFTGEKPGMAESSFQLSAAAFNGILKLANGSEPNVHLVLMAAVAALLNRYSGKEEMVLATPAYDDEVDGEEKTLLPILLQVQPGQSFKSLLLQTRQAMIEAIDNQEFSFENWRSLIPVQDHNMDIFSNVIAYRKIQTYQNLSSVKHNLILYFSDAEGIMHLSFGYDGASFNESSLAIIAGHLDHLLVGVSAQPNLPLADLELVSGAERERIFKQLEGPFREMEGEPGLIQQFQYQVNRQSGKTALSGLSGTLTYHELNRLANAIAHRLRNRFSIQPDQHVGLLIGRDLAMVTGILGVMKSGAAYIPLELTLPAGRLANMLRENKPDRLLADAEGCRKLAELNLQPDLIIDSTGRLPDAEEDSNPVFITRPEHKAYQIFTSGSTGTPKSIPIRHGSIVNFIKCTAGIIGYSENERHAILPNYSFDMSVMDIFLALTNGAGLYVTSREAQQNFPVLKKELDAYSPTQIQTTPSILKTLLRTGWKANAGLRILSGAEHLSSALANALLEDAGELWNFYGPTEATVYATCKKIEKDEAISIGKPLPNYYLYLLNNGLQPVPAGCRGEIYIGGEGLSEGYFQRPELNALAFIPDPFRPGRVIYKTGDEGRLNSKGELECRGRLDFQVKLRGNRLEPGEIQAHILQLEGITDAVVILRGTDDKAFLAAYFTAKAPVSVAAIRQHLSASLPAYMVPSTYMQLSSLPLNSNGKVDRNALPEPALPVHSAYEAPQDEWEQQLVTIWADTLGIDPGMAGVRTGFFELGGHSLKATQIILQIRQNFGVEIAMQDFFSHPDIRSQASLIRNTGRAAASDPVEPAAPAEYYPVSPAQKRMYVLSRLEEGIKYNFPLALELRGEPDLKHLESVFRQLIGRHESLRTSFHLTGGQLMQRIHENPLFRLHEFNAEGDADPAAIFKNFFRPFELDQAPVFRAGLIRRGPGRYILMIDLHHIVADGISLDILINDLSRLYRGENLPPLRLQYRDYATWAIRQTEGAGYKASAGYWINRFRDPWPELAMPLDYPRPPVQRFEGDVIKFRLEKQDTRLLNELARNEGVTLFMLLLTVYSTLLHCYSGQTDIVVGTPVAARLHSDLENIVGVFNNTLALRSQPMPGLSFSGYLGQVKAITLEAFDHQTYPFDEMVEKTRTGRNSSRNPVFDTMLSLQNGGRTKISMGDLELLPYPLEQGTSIFDFTLEMEETEDGMVAALQYCTHLFRKTTMQTFISNLVRLIRLVAANPALTLSQINEEIKPGLQQPGHSNTK